MKQSLIVAFDIGSVSINTMIADFSGTLIAEYPYVRHFGRTLELCADILEKIEARYGDSLIQNTVFTGVHSKPIAKALRAFYESEITASVRGMEKLAPDARTIVVMGGHDSALLTLKKESGRLALTGFSLNEACAAGTGSFIDQQAERIFASDERYLHISEPQKKIESILSRFIDEGASSEDPANVACRCTVFTKSDMIHLQNKGIENKHIIAGLHEGVAKNFKSTLINNLVLEEPVYFIGGCASNRLAIKAFEKTLGMKINVPSYHASVPAYGVLLSALENKSGTKVTSSDIRRLQRANVLDVPRNASLQLRQSQFLPAGQAVKFDKDSIKDVYLGLDVGSTTTKLVVIDEFGTVFFKTYIPTEGQPVEAVKKAFKNCTEACNVSKFNVLGVGTTGSGREAAALIAGADDIVNEVTAHAKGTANYAPDVDTIFELGGQDAKYTYLKDGYVADFKMNKVCAAGTGSFLEETANKLGIDIAGEYEMLAMSSLSPYKLAERCTVYMESDLMSYLQSGAAVPDLLAGLSIAVVHNYLNRVVQDGKIGKKISFQGGPSLNRSVVAAFENILGKPVVTLKHREVMGAIGAALHAADIMKLSGKHSQFKGWDADKRAFSYQEKLCKADANCHNQCKLQVYKIDGETAIYGGECGMYESGAQKAKRTPNCANIRKEIFERHLKDKYTVATSEYKKQGQKLVIGLPRALTFYQLGLFWINFFTELGFEVISSPETDKKITDLGLTSVVFPTCFPVKLSHGHAAFLKDKCDFLFLPMMIENIRQLDSARSYYCPYVEAAPFMLETALGLDPLKVMKPAVYADNNNFELLEVLENEFVRVGLNFNRSKISEALEKAKFAQKEFERDLHKAGSEILAEAGDKPLIVVTGRPYSLYDGRANLNLFSSLSRLGVYAIPQDFLDLSEIDLKKEYPSMYWAFGYEILRAAEFIASKPGVFGIYLTSFSCGPDSFVLHFFADEMNKKRKPYLELELDEHSAGAGVETRLLAFIDTIGNAFRAERTPAASRVEVKPASMKGRTMYVPYMCEGARCVAAAFRHIGVKAEVMPTMTEKAQVIGKKLTSGKECYPCVVTTGDMFAKISELEHSGKDPAKDICFLMPEAEGPCRFGQYNKLQRIFLDNLGYENVPILSPTSEDGYTCRGMIPENMKLSFRKLLWQSIVYSDFLEKALWHIRPYEIKRGETDALFEEAMDAAVKVIERGGGLPLLKLAQKTAKRFAQIPKIGEQKPLIGIVGEIFVRSHKGSNQNLVKRLEELGCEAYVASISEWISYTTVTAFDNSKLEMANNPTAKSLTDYLTYMAAISYQDLVYSAIARPFVKYCGVKKDHKTRDLINQSETIFSNHINCEAVLSIGSALNFAKEGFNGIVNAMPFTCMPSTIAASILKVAVRNDIPYIDMVYDGSHLSSRELSLETFAFQAHQMRRGSRE